jgi:hypothetical protein
VGILFRCIGRLPLETPCSSDSSTRTARLAAVSAKNSVESPVAPTQGLVLHYAFGSLANGAVIDQAGDSLDGHVVSAAGSPALVNSLAGHGKAVQLRGTSHQWVDVRLLPVLDVDNNTLSAWVRYTGAKAITGRTCVSGQPVAVGAKNAPAKGLNEAFWDGRLDEVRIDNRALSATEIGQLAARP